MNILNCALSTFSKLSPFDSNGKPNWTHVYKGRLEGSVKTINGDYYDYFYNENNECIVMEAV